MLSTRDAIKIGKRGGKARTRRLSPERRREIAGFARLNRWQREHGAMATADFVRALVHQIRASDPDLAAFVQRVCSMPYRFQERMHVVLTPDEVEVINRAREAVCK